MNLLVNLNPTELNITGGSYQSNIGAEDFDLSAVFSDLPVTSGVSQIVSGVSGLTGVFAGLGGLVCLGDGTFKSTDFDRFKRCWLPSLWGQYSGEADYWWPRHGPRVRYNRFWEDQTLD
jgi:hypothetical protein